MKRKDWFVGVMALIVCSMASWITVELPVGETSSAGARRTPRPFEVPRLNPTGEAKLVWTPVMTGGFGNPENHLLRGLTVFEDRFYAITSGDGDGQVYRSDPDDPTVWQAVVEMGFQEFGNPLNPRFRLIRTVDDQVFVGTASRARRLQGAQIWASGDGNIWRNLFDSAGDAEGRNFSVRAMDSFGGSLYVGMGTEFIGSARIYRSQTGLEWELVMGDGFGKPRRNQSVYALSVFQGHLYAATFNLAGAEVYRTLDGRNWEQVAYRGFGSVGNLYIYELRSFQPTPEMAPRLIAITGGNPSGGEVRIYDGEGWSLFAPAGFGKPRNTDLWQANQFGPDFYVGTFKVDSKESSDAGTELWRYDSQLGEWIPETLDGFGNPNNTGIRVIFPWNGALYVSTLNKVTGCELWKGTPR